MKRTMLHSAVGSALVLITMTSACSSHAPERPPFPTAPEARASMQDLVRDTMTTTDIDWRSENGNPSPDECSLPDGTSGVSFSWNHEASGVDDPQSTARTAGAHWTDLGYDVHYRQGAMNPGGTLYSAIAVGPAVTSISVNASKYRVSVHVDSPCGTGDIDAYLDELIDPEFRN